MAKVTQNFFIFVAVLVLLYFIHNNLINIDNPSSLQIKSEIKDFNVGNLMLRDNLKVYSKRKLAVLVPVRNCLENVLRFVPHLSKFLNNQEIPHHIFMVHQEDVLRFNRAALLNIGYLYTKDKFDYTVQHDVDLLPLNPKLSYEFPEGDIVFHVMNTYFHPAVNYRNLQRYIGGILVVPNQVYDKVDGMNRNYWGWDHEDDEFQHHLDRFNISIVHQSTDIGTSYDDTVLHLHYDQLRPRDRSWCNNQSTDAWAVREPDAGLRSTQYDLVNVQQVTIEGYEATFLNVRLKCDFSKTPWCDCSRTE